MHILKVTLIWISLLLQCSYWTIVGGRNPNHSFYGFNNLGSLWYQIFSLLWLSFSLDPKNDPISKNNSIVLSGSIHRQSEDVIVLSPSRQLVADALGVDDYTYDGCGNTIRLVEETDGKGPHSGRSQPIIVIGRSKRLRFVNVKIEVQVHPHLFTFLFQQTSSTFLLM